LSSRSKVGPNEVDTVRCVLQGCGVLGLITRSAVPADVPAIHRLIADGERHHGGRVLTAVDAVAADLARPTLDPARDTLLVYAPEGELVGWSWMHTNSHARGAAGAA
jgi:mycothiol synthase